MRTCQWQYWFKKEIQWIFQGDHTAKISYTSHSFDYNAHLSCMYQLCSRSLIKLPVVLMWKNKWERFNKSQRGWHQKSSNAAFHSSLSRSFAERHAELHKPSETNSYRDRAECPCIAIRTMCWMGSLIINVPFRLAFGLQNRLTLWGNVRKQPQ